MRYTSRHDGPLVPQEKDVALALRDYAPSRAKSDWVPASTLWSRYVTWWAGHRWQWHRDPTFPGHYPRLSKRQFGAAVRRVYPGVRRVRRRRVSEGRRYGYLGLAVAE
jgi:hypothetical protein